MSTRTHWLIQIFFLSLSGLSSGIYQLYECKSSFNICKYLLLEPLTGPRLRKSMCTASRGLRSCRTVTNGPRTLSCSADNLMQAFLHEFLHVFSQFRPCELRLHHVLGCIDYSGTFGSTTSADYYPRIELSHSIQHSYFPGYFNDSLDAV